MMTIHVNIAIRDPTEHVNRSYGLCLRDCTEECCSWRAKKSLSCHGSKASTMPMGWQHLCSRLCRSCLDFHRVLFAEGFGCLLLSPLGLSIQVNETKAGEALGHGIRYVHYY